MDYVAASFVRTAEGVREIRDFAAEVVRAKFGPDHPPPLIISKIESQEALDNWDEVTQPRLGGGRSPRLGGRHPMW